MPTRYDKEFKQNIINLYKQGESAAQLAREYGIGYSTVHKWIDLETPIAKLIMRKPDTDNVKFTADDKHLYLNGESVLDISPNLEEKVKKDDAEKDKKEDKD